MVCILTESDGCTVLFGHPSILRVLRVLASIWYERYTLAPTRPSSHIHGSYYTFKLSLESDGRTYALLMCSIDPSECNAMHNMRMNTHNQVDSMQPSLCSASLCSAYMQSMKCNTPPGVVLCSCAALIAAALVAVCSCPAPRAAGLAREHQPPAINDTTRRSVDTRKPPATMGARALGALCGPSRASV